MKLESTKRERLAEMYDKYGDDLYCFLKKYTKGKGGCQYLQDVAQETFLRYAQNMDKVKEDMEFPWLVAVAKNVMVSWVRKEKRELAEDNTSTLWEEHNTEISAEETVVEEECAKTLHEFKETIFQRLYVEHPKWYEIIIAVYILEIPQCEVAKQQEMSVVALHSMLGRIRRWLRKYYGDEFDKYVKGK